jgi:ADP-heptose:LPS heptosyltransferase
MIVFRVSQNINIKATDGTLVNYFRFKGPSNMENETIYITTYTDFIDLKTVFEKVDKNRYIPKVFDEKRIRDLENFPIELGISNLNEYTKREENKNYFSQDIKYVDIYKQLINIKKDEIKVAIIGGIGASISEIISSSSALRILHKKLKEIYKNVKFDVYINASNNSYYTRDKQIYLTQDYVSNVFPLSISSKKLCEYDYFIDNSFEIGDLLKELNSIDAWLTKFGIDYKKINDNEKYSVLNLLNYKPQDSLISKIQSAKQKGKVLLFHPYSANINKSIPQAFAVEFLKEIILKLETHTVFTTLNVDNKIKEFNYIDLSKESKTIEDFIFIISSMDEVITVDTATYHISEAFMIPTITIFTENDFNKKLKYYNYIKPIYVKDRSKNLSKFIYENDNLTINKFDSWKKLKINKIIKLLDSF